MFIRVTRKKNKIQFITLWKKRNSISISYYLYYLKILFEGKVDLTYSDFSFMIGTNFVTNYLYSLKKKIYIIFYYTVLLSPHYVFLLCAKL